MRAYICFFQRGMAQSRHAPPLYTTGGSIFHPSPREREFPSGNESHSHKVTYTRLRCAHQLTHKSKLKSHTHTEALLLFNFESQWPIIILKKYFSFDKSIFYYFFIIETLLYACRSGAYICTCGYIVYIRHGRLRSFTQP